VKQQFYKWQALGNDFILIESPPLQNCMQIIPHLCHRRLGIGADGVIFLDLSYPIPKMIFFNADGTQVSMCGNGLRSAMMHLVSKNREPAIEFNNMIYLASLEHSRWYVDMPYPSVLEVDNPPHQGLWVQAGVPHFLIEKENVHEGAIHPDFFSSRYHPSFGPLGTNITFYQKKGNTFYLRTCERGVDEETLSCGSAAIACAYISNEEQLEMIYPSGQRAWVRKKGEKIALAGEAQCVFLGEIEV
jgi:diaminopimelate epimerase